MQPKRPRINPLILALALAAVLMVWSVMGSGSGSTSGSTMSYSTVVHYFEHNQVTAFTLDRNTSVITLNLKEGDLPLPDVSSTQSTVQSTGGLLSGMFSSSSESTGAVQEDDGTVTVRYKLPYAYVFIENVDKYIESYDAANPDAPMTYDYTSLKETIPWMEIIFYLGMLGCTGFLLFSMMRGGVGGGGGIMNVGKAKVKDEHENKKTNSPGESTVVISKFMQWTDDRQIHIHTVLHQNKNDEHARGHVGTELNNKAETVMQIEPDKDDKSISVVEVIHSRDREFEPFVFQVNDDSLPELVESYQPQERQPGRPPKEPFDPYKEIPEDTHRSALNAAFEGGNINGYDNLIEQLKEGYGRQGIKLGHNKAVKLATFLSNKRMVVKEGKEYKFNRDFYY